MSNKIAICKYCWKCCGVQNSAISMQDARNQLEKHKIEKHKGKQLGSFSIEYSHKDLTQ